MTTHPTAAPHLPFSYFKTCRDLIPAGQTNLEKLRCAIRDGRWKREVDECREALCNDGEDCYNTIRQRTIPAVTLCARVATRAASATPEERQAEFSRLLQIDTDDLGDDLSRVRLIFQNAPFIVACWISLSGDGLKAVARIPIGENAIPGAWQAAKVYFAAHSITIDEAPKSPWSLCFISYDPAAYFNPDAVEIVPLEVTEKPVIDAGDEDATEDTDTIWERLKIKNKLVPMLLNGEWEGGKFSSQSDADFSLACSICEETRNHEQQEEIFRDSGLYRDERKIRVTFPNARIRVAQQLAAKLAKLPAIHDEAVDLTRFDCNDHGNAERVHAYAGSNFHHIIESASWIVWNGFRWVPDVNGGMTRLFVSAMQITGKQAFEISDRSRADSIVKHAFKSRDTAKVQAGLQMLRSLLGVSVSVNDLDADPWMIGTAEGVIDLKTGRPVLPDRSKLITKKIGTRYDETATCPTWERFLHTVTAGNSELIRFLQIAVGYSLTGSNAEQCLFFLFGLGQNGKGVFSETTKRLFGDYGQVAPESMFVKDRNQSATNDIARLAGCRLAVASELGEGIAFAESRLKSLTGNDSITARFLHREFFDFIPTHHFWISGNHKPTIQGSDHGIWRRIHLIPFTVRISDAEKDPDLIRKIAEEMPGILNWALAGCMAWQREGLSIPRCVSQATAEYRSEEDIVGQFLQECTIEESRARVLASELYEAFHRWSVRGGIKCPIRSKDFGKRMDERGYQRMSSSGARYWTGLSLGETEEEV